MTTYAELDLIIKRWSVDRRIPLSTRYKDEDVRSFQIVGASGGMCQIWIEVGDDVTVRVWDYHQRSRDLEADAASLYPRLDEALSLASSWVQA